MTFGMADILRRKVNPSVLACFAGNLWGDSFIASRSFYCLDQTSLLGTYFATNEVQAFGSET
jgi:hypothetical protein